MGKATGPAFGRPEDGLCIAHVPFFRAGTAPRSRLWPPTIRYSRSAVTGAPGQGFDQRSAERSGCPGMMPVLGPGSTLVRSMAKKPGVLRYCYRFAGILEVSKWLLLF